ncbi:hypothetical protein FB479_11646 [Brevibacillus sp. AG162]|uniref:hypothetical protein n=1 Tax=Brevibacillus sp. AG162 TaxID=2572910 RepID=UPI00115018A2|nr:hypothetical protein [Brevibacillus sp. AG162]TQK41945.1 hypothetical protein FB479_11646 [Brevibacillus sp. AG162]
MYDHDFDMDENYGFNTQLNEMIDQEVEKRLEAKVNGYHATLEREKRVVQVQHDQQKKIREIEQQLKDAEKTFFKQGADQTKRELMGGFKPGDKVWFAKEDWTISICDTCQGKGSLEVMSVALPEPLTVTCPNCRGSRSKKENTFISEQGTICEIKIHMRAQGRCFESTFYIEPVGFRSNIDPWKRNHTEIFHTEEECQRYVNDILNPPVPPENVK